jgi:hypothetical protein
LKAAQKGWPGIPPALVSHGKAEYNQLKQEKGESNYLAEIDGSGLQENNISTNNKMTSSKKSKKANAMPHAASRNVRVWNGRNGIG